MMKKALFLTIFFILGAAGLVVSQDLSSSINTILQYEVSLDPQILKALDPRELRSENQKEKLRRNQAYVFRYLAHESLNLIEERFKARSVEWVPMDSLTEYELAYDTLGFPIPTSTTAAIKQLNKAGFESDYYLAFDVNVGIQEDIFGSGGLSKQFKQKTVIQCTVLNSNGRKLRLIEGIETNSRPTRIKDFPEKEFDKTSEDSIDKLLEYLTPGLVVGIDKLLENF